MEQTGAVWEDFEIWYVASHRRLLGSMYLLCGDLDLAGEVTDETCARALERWSRVGRMASPTGWAYVVASRELRRRERRLRRERHVSVVLTETGSQSAVAVELWALLEDLAPRQRAAVVLRHVGDLTEADIAAVMGVTRSTVSNTLHDAYRNLRMMLTAPAEEGPDANTY